MHGGPGKTILGSERNFIVASGFPVTSRGSTFKKKGVKTLTMHWAPSHPLFYQWSQEDPQKPQCWPLLSREISGKTLTFSALQFPALGKNNAGSEGFMKMRRMNICATFSTGLGASKSMADFHCHYIGGPISLHLALILFAFL